MTDNNILKYFCGPKLKKIQKKKLESIPEDIKEYLDNRFNNSYSYRETILRILKHIEIKPKCPICGNYCELHPYKSKFLDTCNNKNCKKELKKLHFEKSMIEKYGYKYNFENNQILKKSIELSKSNESKKKAKQTCLKLYGVEHFTNREKYSLTYKSKSENEKKEIRQKIKQTKLERYGNENYNNPSLTKQTKLERYGNENYTNLEKAKQTCLKLYGVENPLNSKEIQQKIHDNQIKKYGCLGWNTNKTKETNLIKYGVENVFTSKEIQNKIKQSRIKHFGKYLSDYQIEKSHNEIANLKRYQTMKQNNSFKKSKPEDLAYELLKKKFKDIQRQYKSELYPFHCDFYIPSLDLYIEYNGSQYHNKHFFDENNKNDIRLLNELKDKANKSKRHQEGKKSQYDNIIYVWTDLDVRKRNMAIKNNLNYKVFWNIEELKEWLNNE